MPETIRLYELVYIIAPDRSDEQVQTVIDKYSKLITSLGGTVDKTDIWERRRLAYEIGGYNEGLYVVATFHAVPAVEAELRRVFRISEDTLRFIIVRPGEQSNLPEPVAAPAPRAHVEPAPAQAEPVQEEKAPALKPPRAAKREPKAADVATEGPQEAPELSAEAEEPVEVSA